LSNDGIELRLSSNVKTKEELQRSGILANGDDSSKLPPGFRLCILNVPIPSVLVKTVSLLAVYNRTSWYYLTVATGSLKGTNQGFRLRRSDDLMRRRREEGSHRSWVVRVLSAHITKLVHTETMVYMYCLYI
jgi:hypothetical protein